MSKIIWLILLITLSLIGFFGIYQSIAGFAAIKLLIDPLSKDGNLSLLTPGVYQNLTLPALMTGVFSLFLALFLFINQAISIGFLQQACDDSRLLLLKFGRDVKQFASALRAAFPHNKTESMSLLIIITAGIINRLFLINRAIEYDEAYTYIEFARHSLKWITTTYYVVNNHVFSTILIHFSTALLGHDVWVIRLPSFIMGIISMITAYLLTKKLYGTRVGLLAASLMASVPVEILCTTRARGYSIIACMGLLSFLAAVYVLQHKNLVGWLVLALAGAIGFYAVPIMLYPYGIVFTWLLLNGLAHKFSNDYDGLINWLKYLLITGLLSGLLTLFVYMPIIINHGLWNVILRAGGPAPQPPGVFISAFPDRLSEIYSDWSIGLPPVMTILLGVGMLLSILFNRRANRKIPHVSTQLAFIVFMTGILLVQRPHILERFMLWVVPLLLIWCASGWWWSVESLHGHFSNIKGINLAAWGNLLILVVLLLGGCFSLSIDPNKISQTSFESEEITIQLDKYLTDKDIVVVTDKCDAPFWYYFDYYGMPQSSIRNIKARPFKNAYIIVTDKELLEEVINNNEYINRHLLAENAAETIQYPHFTVYKFTANKRAQIKSFPSISQEYWK